MVHNGIEYALMAAYAEGLGILHQANIGLRKSVVNAETALGIARDKGAKISGLGSAKRE